MLHLVFGLTTKQIHQSSRYCIALLLFTTILTFPGISLENVFNKKLAHSVGKILDIGYSSSSLYSSHLGILSNHPKQQLKEVLVNENECFVIIIFFKCMQIGLAL